MDAFSGTKGAAIARAVLVPAVATMEADGEIGRREVAQVSNLCGFSPIFEGYSNEEIEELIRSIRMEIEAEGAALAKERAAPKLSPALRETALCFAVRIALADGRLSGEETETLARTAATLGVDGDTFVSIYSVMEMMQRTPED